MKAFLKNYRQSPRKVRLVASLIRGKGALEAVAELNFLAKRAGDPIKKLLLSAMANAKNNSNLEMENLFVKEIRVDKGIVMKRMMPAAMGTGHRINKRTSHITLLLAEKVSKTEKPKSENKTEKPAKTVKKEKEVKAEKPKAKKVVKKSTK